MRMRPREEDLDEYELEDLKEKRLEMKRLKAERDLLRMKAEVEKTRQELSKYAGETPEVVANPGGPTTALGAMIASMVKAGVKAEEANEFLSKMNPEALATLSALTSNNPYLPIFMFLASQSRNVSPQNMTPKDVIELNKSVFSLAKDISGGKGEGDTTVVLKELSNIVKDLYNKQLLDKLEDLAARMQGRSVWDEILEDEKKFQRFKELFGGGGSNPEVQIKLEQLRQQHELELKKLDLELLKLRSQMVESKRRSKMFAEGLRKIGQAVGEGLEEARRGGLAYRAQEAQPAQAATVKCPKCGADIPDVKPGAVIECPSCHTKYEARVK